MDAYLLIILFVFLMIIKGEYHLNFLIIFPSPFFAIAKFMWERRMKNSLVQAKY